jgi:hypothetical protein
MKSLSVMSVVCLVLLASSWAAGQTVRGNSKEGQALY